MNLTAFADGKSGDVGSSGTGGANGSNGSVSVNFTPLNATPSYAYYIPTLTCDLNKVQEAMRSGIDMNASVYSSRTIIPFHTAIERNCVEVVKTMTENPDLNNRPNLDLPIIQSNGNSMDIYYFLLIGENNKTNVAVRTTNLEMFRAIIAIETNANRLASKTFEVLNILVAPDNDYKTYANNLEAVQLVQIRLQQLGWKN